MSILNRLMFACLTTTLGHGLVVSRLAAQTRTSADTQTTQDQSPLEIRIVTSRREPTAGLGAGVSAELRNVSRKNIFVRPSHVTLSVPPEISGPGRWDAGIVGYFPGYLGTSDSVFMLGPGDSYAAFWALDPGLTPKDTTGNLGSVFKQIRTELKFLFFTPADYELTVGAQFWTDSVTRSAAHSTVKTATVHYSAPQFVILLGAAIGGILCYLLFRTGPRGAKTKTPSTSHLTSKWRRYYARHGATWAAVFLSALWSAVVTILLDRLSDTQFLVKVSVNDFWGAIAIGFVASYVGVKAIPFLNKDVTPKPRSADVSGAPATGRVVSSSPSSGHEPASTPTESPVFASDTEYELLPK